MLLFNHIDGESFEIFSFKFGNPISLLRIRILSQMSYSYAYAHMFAKNGISIKYPMN